MGISLSKKELENIKLFRYKTHGATPVEKAFYEPFWNAVANNCVHDWIAPNALTLLGAVFPIALAVVVGLYNPGFDETTPRWVPLLGFFALFWYQTIDAIDGKHARRTNNCSPLG